MPKIEYIKEYFVTRVDRIGIYRNDRIQSIDIDEHDLDGYIKAHLKGDNRIGFYTLFRDSTVKWAVIDIDNHNNDEEVKKKNKAFIRQFMELSDKVGLHYNIERSKSNSCHIWIFFKEQIPAQTVRRFLKNYVMHVGNNAALDQEYIRGIEIFPKQDSIPENGYGNFVWLPFFGGTDAIGKGVNNDKTVFYEDNIDETS